MIGWWIQNELLLYIYIDIDIRFNLEWRAIDRCFALLLPGIIRYLRWYNVLSSSDKYKTYGKTRIYWIYFCLMMYTRLLNIEKLKKIYI